MLTSYTPYCMGDGTPGQGRRQKSPCAKTFRSPCLAGVAGRLFTPDFLLLEHSSLALLCYVDLLSPQRYQTLLKQDIHICLLQNPVQEQWEMLLRKPCHSQSSAAGGPGQTTSTQSNEHSSRLASALNHEQHCKVRSFTRPGDLFYVPRAGTRSSSWDLVAAPGAVASCLSLISTCKTSSRFISLPKFKFFVKTPIPITFLAPSCCVYSKATCLLTFLAPRKGFLHQGGGMVTGSRLPVPVLCLPAASGSLKTKQK